VKGLLTNPPSLHSSTVWKEASCSGIAYYEKGKLTLNSMITIAGNYAAADDDAHESLKASAI
jgi:hypothetical protein